MALSALQLRYPGDPGAEGGAGGEVGEVRAGGGGGGLRGLGCRSAGSDWRLSGARSDGTYGDSL